MHPLPRSSHTPLVKPRVARPTCDRFQRQIARTLYHALLHVIAPGTHITRLPKKTSRVVNCFPRIGSSGRLWKPIVLTRRFPFFQTGRIRWTPGGTTMAHKFLAFDIETAKIVPGTEFNWKAHRPLGVTCIASQATDEQEPRVWLTKTPKGTPAPQMKRADIAAFVRFLDDVSRKGFVPLSWNGLAFDLDVLAEESGLPDECRKIARGHVDMMFHVVCEKGFPVALEERGGRAPVAGQTCRCGRN